MKHIGKIVENIGFGMMIFGVAFMVGVIIFGPQVLHIDVHQTISISKYGLGILLLGLIVAISSTFFS